MSAGDFEAFAKFVAEELAIRLDRIHPASRLEEDLECTGDDSDLFLQIHANRFDVDLSALWFSDHFHSTALAASIPQEAMSHDKVLRSLLFLAMLSGVLWLALYNGISTSREYIRDRIARCAEAARAGMSPAPAESD